ncbi:MAG: hypothetical protein HRU03_04825 [Nanoarchaeales archaeon]|nr:hypothetical protein [Nanoarchaeales archaeon]
MYKLNFTKLISLFIVFIFCSSNILATGLNSVQNSNNTALEKSLLVTDTKQLYARYSDTTGVNALLSKTYQKASKNEGNVYVRGILQ